VSIMKERKGSHLVAQSPYMLSSTCVLWLMSATVQSAQDFLWQVRLDGKKELLQWILLVDNNWLWCRVVHNICGTQFDRWKWATCPAVHCALYFRHSGFVGLVAEGVEGLVEQRGHIRETRDLDTK
jgi:hypothetical protein